MKSYFRLLIKFQILFLFCQRGGSGCGDKYKKKTPEEEFRTTRVWFHQAEVWCEAGQSLVGSETAEQLWFI